MTSLLGQVRAHFWSFSAVKLELESSHSLEQ